jgi:hypothetical protein
MAMTDMQSERDNLYDYVNGLLGLLRLIRGRDDVNAEVKDVLRTNHRVVDAAAYLTQIMPPNDGVEIPKEAK